MTSLGILLFHALDYGLCDDEERSLSKPLELLIERLTSANELARRARRRQRRRRLKAKRARTDSERFDSIGTEEAEEDDEDEDDEDDEDEEHDEDVGGNTDEGIEDCHEHEECHSRLQLVNFDQVMQVSRVVVSIVLFRSSTKCTVVTLLEVHHNQNRCLCVDIVVGLVCV